jgi:hypothetical protein
MASFDDRSNARPRAKLKAGGGRDRRLANPWLFHGGMPAPALWFVHEPAAGNGVNHPPSGSPAETVT